MNKNLVIPGDLLSSDVKQAGDGTYVKDGQVFAALFGFMNKKDRIQVIPLAGKYMPQGGDVVIGKIVDVRFSNWLVDIRSPYVALLHISEYPERIDADQMGQYLGIGDLVVGGVKDVDVTMKVELTMYGESFKKIDSGRVIEISHAKIPRVIGRKGSMISLLKSELNCDIFIGQNGRIWVKGREEDINYTVKTLLKIESESHTPGLTDRIKEFISRRELTTKQREE